MRLLILADEESWLPLPALIASHAPDVVVTLGDLAPDVLDPLGRFALPVLGVYGNHDDGRYLEASNTSNMHLAQTTVGGTTFTGFEGCVQYTRGAKLQYTQRQASRLARRLPSAEILISHAPPRGIHEEPDDRAHEGFDGLREYILRAKPRLHLHGHTPAPARRAQQLGETTVVHVVGHHVLEI
ncbi:metallophosphoesterase family protein [Baekduia sp.]|jgi:Icc-related predicted phosphoesterase|uniref:metallophosphoesterase family protein n=1 Tax=Baekduia sp. TaxID=2600305 RepID=UPI002E00C397|nr:metallophosphoesterase family protein [Baekduia sp.]